MTVLVAPAFRALDDNRQFALARDRPVRHIVLAIMLAGGPFAVGASLAFGDGAGDPTPIKNESGKYYDKQGNPTFKVQSDGTVDWSTYSGFRAITPIAMSVMVPTAKDRVTLRRSAMS